MARDIVYYYDKKSPYQQHELGEIQTDFNFSAVIDGTKDSCQVIVLSFDEPAIEPYTIVKLNTLGLWYIISEDKVERYLNENGSFVYKHQLSLLGAKELLNARDLTDCGFYQNRYTIDDFIRRIIKLSSFEFPYTIEYSSNGSLLLDQTKVVDYIKTYQNFTPLSALRDFFDGYNCTFRLDFTTTTSNNITYLDRAKIKIMSKTGDIGLTQLSISHFDDVRENKNLNKDSFGTTTISNAENVISSKTKFYPSTGAARIITDQAWKITRQNAIWRLPSNIYKINWMKVVCDNIRLELNYAGIATFYSKLYMGTAYDGNFKSLLLTTVANSILSVLGQAQYDNFIKNIDEIIKTFQMFTSIKFYPTLKYDATNNKFFFLPDAPTDAKIIKYEDNELSGGTSIIGLFDKETANSTRRPDRHFWYERGNNVIHLTQGWTGEFTENNWMSFTTKSFEIQGQSTGYANTEKYTVYSNGDFSIVAYRRHSFQLRREYLSDATHPINNAWRMVCEYIPMSDIKVKVDNELETKDTDLYNQTGKQTDSVALSKLLDTHSTEISSDTITRYKNYYDYNDIPKVGQIVLKDTIKYVINNISYNVYQNENTDEDNDKVQYYFECEFTLSKAVAVKSIMVNPNTNIRDYGIPQTYNVRRKQLYRDYYSFDLSSDPNADTEWYIDLYTFISFDIEPAFDQNFVLLIKAGANYYKYTSGDAYDTPVSYNYYQVEATNYLLKKSFYIVFDFQDNNIIGYDAQSVWAGFDISRIFDQSDKVSTPISYVDQNGFVKSFELLITNQSNITLDNDNSMLTNRVFISDTFYNLNKNNGYLALIDELEYEKDPTEVPVFEYACQLGNSDNVIVGENLLAYEEGATYLYGYVLRDYNTTTENNAEIYATNDIEFVPFLTISNAVKIEKGVIISTPQTNVSIQNGGGIANEYSSLSFDYYARTTLNIEGSLTSYEIISKGPHTTDVYVWQVGNQVIIEMHSNLFNVSVRARVKLTTQTTANTLYKDRIKLSFYQTASPLANSYVNQLRPTTGKDICVYRYQINNGGYTVVVDISTLTQEQLDELNPGTLVYSTQTLGDKWFIIEADHSYTQASLTDLSALIEKKELVFIIRNYTFIGGNQDVILYINHYKVD